MEELLALSVHRWQAERILQGQKTETVRSWSPHYRGPLALHATSDARVGGHRAGAIVGIVNLVDCIPATIPGQWAWQLSDPVPLEQPVPCHGSLRLWPVPPRIAVSLLAVSIVALRRIVTPEATPALIPW